MKCLVINLDSSRDRLAHMTEQFARIGVAFERVPAIEKPDGSRVTLQRLTGAEICCFHSHRHCWQIIADGTDRYGAVFEDDIIFSSDAGPLLADDGWVPRDADLVKLETYFVPVRLGRKRTPIGNGYSVVRLVGQHVGAAGYVISKEAARTLLKRTKRIRGAVDDALFSPTLMTCARNTIYQLMSAPCAQAKFLGGDSPETLIQFDVPERQWQLLEKVRTEASRAYAHLRNRTFFGTDKVDAVAFRGE
ncbi:MULTISPECIES: glycosyltransferase family 25 protein [Mesorhizobium]|uniref:glycosyltransferase family 25 protein n=2 Tax=Mesorhizobium australicum TaxID=536018 RepID=UPI00333A4B39